MGSEQPAHGHCISSLQQLLLSAVLLLALHSQPCAAAPADLDPQGVCCARHA